MNKHEFEIKRFSCLQLMKDASSFYRKGFRSKDIDRLVKQWSYRKEEANFIKHALELMEDYEEISEKEN